MYTHARQFPHFAGKSDAEIREAARRALLGQPRLARMMRIRNAAVYLSMLVAAALLARMTTWSLGSILMLVGAVATAFVLLWNVVWVNTVLFRITRDEVARGDDVKRS